MKLFIKGLLKIFGVKTAEVAKPAIVETTRLASKVTGATTEVALSSLIKFTDGFSEEIANHKRQSINKPNEDIKRIKEDWAYIIGKSDKPSAKTSRRNTRPSIQSQRLMNRF